MAALAALWWAHVVLQTGDVSAAEEDELQETVSELMEQLSDEAASESGSEAFLDDLSTLASKSPDGEPVAVAWEEQTDLVSMATVVLEAYEDLGDASLATSGYLDLFGNSWGAVVCGGATWVDIVVVTTEDDETSAARIIRLLPEDVDGDA